MYEIYAKLRDQKGVTDYRVSKELGISRTALSEWKKGTYNLKAEKLQLIADYFGVPLDYLMTGEVKTGYYTDEKTAEIAQTLFENKELSALFDVQKDLKPEDLQTVYQLVLALKRKEQG